MNNQSHSYFVFYATQKNKRDNVQFISISRLKLITQLTPETYQPGHLPGN